MERVLKLTIATLLGVALLAPAAARAGGVVTDGRGGTVASSGYTFTYPGDLPYSAMHLPDRLALAQSTGATAAAETDADPLTGASGTELEQIAAGLITEEEASSGCGGATAARGDLGLLSVLVAGLALVLSRRR